MKKQNVFQGFEAGWSKSTPKGIREIDLTPEIRQRQRSRNGIRYDELLEALSVAHKNGRGVEVDAKMYWEGWKDRSIYMALRRLGQRYKVSIKSDRSHRESNGVVYLWLDETTPAPDTNRRGPGRPRKAA